VAASLILAATDKLISPARAAPANNTTQNRHNNSVIVQFFILHYPFFSEIWFFVQVGFSDWTADPGGSINYVRRDITHIIPKGNLASRGESFSILQYRNSSIDEYACFRISVKRPYFFKILFEGIQRNLHRNLSRKRVPIKKDAEDL
jgi:hypothetical protein